MHKRTTILLLVLVLVTAWSMAAFAAASPKYRHSDLNRRMDYYRAAGDEDGRLESSERSTWGSQVAVGNPPPGSPGYRVGETTYDYQHNGSTGRQVDRNGNVIQVTWMKGTAFSTATGRNVYWNRIPVNGSPTTITLDNGTQVDVLPLGAPLSTDGQPAVTAGDRPGYTTFRLIPGSSRGVAFMHDAPETGGGAIWFAGVDPSPGNGVFLQSIASQPPGTVPSEEVIWPKGTVDFVGTDTILHVIARGSGDADEYDQFWYWRGDCNGSTVTWSAPVFIDTGATISQIVEQDPGSNEVALLYSRTINFAYTGGTAQVRNDLILRRSTNGGLNWGPREFVTDQDTLVAGYFPYTDIGAVYDNDGTLHVIYNTRRWYDDGSGELGLFNVPVHLWHWNDERQTSREISSLDTFNLCGTVSRYLTGSWNLLMCKPNLAVKPAGVFGIPEEILYAVWVQSGPTKTDCATVDSTTTLGGYANSEIWVSASSDNGLTWDRPVNITGTETPNCQPGNCRSEHWVTAAARADSGIYLSYVMDTHAGGIVQDEGVWSTSPYMVYVPKARTPVVEPRISVTPTNFQELNVKPVNPGATGTVEVAVNNVGNATLNFNVQVTTDGGGISHVLVNGGSTFSGSILAAGAPSLLTIQFDGVGLTNPSEHDWRLEITSNDAANDPAQGGTPISVKLNVFVADPWYTCTRKEFNNGQRNLAVSSCLAVGDQGEGGGLATLPVPPGTKEYLFEASPVVTINGTPNNSWVDMFWSGVTDRSRDSNRAFRAQDSISLDVTGARTRAFGSSSTTDSVFRLDWEVFLYNDPAAVDGYVAHYELSSFKPKGYTGVVQYGAAADLDVDSLSAWNDGIASEAKQYVGAQGGYGEDSIGQASYVPQNKFAAIFYVALDASCQNQGEGGQVLDNPTYVYDEGNYNRDSLRIRMAGIVAWSSANFPTDTISDLNVLMKHGEIVGWNGTQTAEWAYGMAVSDLSIPDLESKISKLRSLFNPNCISGCLIQLDGDVNESGAITSADIIYLVNFVFKGQAAPKPCQANGDVNCSGSVTSADIIYLVNHVFKGQAKPCDICNSGTPLANQCT